ncbi:hypothetical protein EGY31_24385 [Burkholderia multivorans]|nr:hypothetical protein EGY31_24385 [Burkholderia multivorans]
MGARPTDTNLFHEPGEKEGDQTCYYNGFSRPSFGVPDLCSSCQQGRRPRRDGCPPHGLERAGAACRWLASHPAARPGRRP